MASTQNRRKIERNEHMYFTRCSMCLCVCTSLRYRQPMQEMHVTYAYVTIQI